MQLSGYSVTLCDIKTIESAKAKAEELLQDWLNQANLIPLDKKPTHCDSKAVELLREIQGELEYDNSNGPIVLDLIQSYLTKHKNK